MGAHVDLWVPVGVFFREDPENAQRIWRSYAGVNRGVDLSFFNPSKDDFSHACIFSLSFYTCKIMEMAWICDLCVDFYFCSNPSVLEQSNLLRRMSSDRRILK